MATRPQRPSVNGVGDLVLTEPRAMLALAAPERLRIVDTLRREGPLSPAALTAALDEDAGTGMRPLRVTAPPRSC